MSLTFEVECAACGAALDASVKDDTIEVEPCLSCLECEHESGVEDGKEQGYSDGYQDGFAEGSASGEKADPQTAKTEEGENNGD